MWSGIFMVPVIMLFAPFGSEGTPGLLSYWILGAAVIMWVVERIAYFTLIRGKMFTPCRPPMWQRLLLW